MMQSLTQSIAIMTDHQRATQALLNAIVAIIVPAGQNPQNPNLANPTINNQARVPPLPMAPANINPPQVPPAQDPVTTWLHLKHQQPRQYPQASLDGPYASQDTYNIGQYTESIVDQAKENEAITILKEHMKALNQKMAEKANDIIDL